MRQVLLLAVAASVCANAATEWIEVNSPNFQLLTTAGSGDAKHTIEYFEQVRDFFMRARSAPIANRVPVTIVLFRNAKEYKPYTPNEVADAFYIGDQSRDFIVMSGSGENERPTAVHEYVHLLVRNMDLKLPVWLNEGLADVYSSLTPYGGKIAIGMVPKGRAYSLGFEKWIPLERILAVQHDSPEYNERARAGAFYAQSWMLTHMLMLGEGYSKQFGNLLAAIDGGASSEEAFQKVYSRSVAEVNRDLQGYYRSSSLKAALFNTKLQKFDGLEPHPAEPFTVELLLSRVAALTGRGEQAKSRLETLARQNPARWEVHEALGNLAWRNRDREAARKSLGRAVDLKPPLWSVYWDYARVAQGVPEEREKVIAALTRTLQLNGANLDAKFALAYELFEAGKYEESLAAYSVMRSVPPSRAPMLFLGQAHAAVRLNKFDLAKTAALNAQKYAKEPRDVQSAAQLIEYLERHEQAEAQRREWDKVRGHQQAVAVAPALQRPPAADKQEQEVPTPAAEVRSSVRGRLKQVDCLITQARLHLEADGRNMSLLITDPDAITIRNQPGSSVNLTCGAQNSPRLVAIEYVDKVDAQTKTTGHVRTVEFLTK